MPAAGAVETDFGEQTKYGGRSKGLLIKTRHGAQVTAPSDGWVVYAGKFRTYGQLLIIKAGEGYHILLAGLSRIDVQSGQFVLTGEPVGTMKSAPGRRIDQNSPRLYVEFRKDGRPINPRPWWSAGSRQKVQG
jgi:septal ring factor EnvC (AmiA/AmiB activator)